MLAGLLQFVVGDQLPGELVELGQRHLDRLHEVLGGDARADAEMPGVAEAADARAHAVGQAAPLAHLHEEPAAHAAAQHLVEQAEGVAVGVVAGEGAQREPQVALLDVAGLQAHGAVVHAVARVRDRRRAAGRSVVPVAPRQRQHGVRVDVAGDAEHHVGGPVPRLDVPHEVGPIDGRHALQVARHVPPQRLVAVGRLGQELRGALGRLVVGAPDLLLDDGALALHLLGVEQRAAHAVGEDVEGQVEPVERDAVPVAGQFLGREGVEHAAGALDGGADLHRVGARLGALEQHVLEVVREPQRAPRLLTAAHADVDRQRGGLRLRQRRHDEPQPVGERRRAPGGAGLGFLPDGCAHRPDLPAARGPTVGRLSRAGYAFGVQPDAPPARYEYNWNPLLGCLQGLLRAAGLPHDAARVGAVSGEAFRLPSPPAAGVGVRPSRPARTLPATSPPSPATWRCWACAPASTCGTCDRAGRRCWDGGWAGGCAAPWRTDARRRSRAWRAATSACWWATTARAAPTGSMGR